MKIQKAYKTELNPNNEQKTILEKHCGTARFAYNWGLAERIRLYEEQQKSTNAIEQHRELNKLKPIEFPWMYEVSKCSPQEALRDLDKAFKNFFRSVKQKAVKFGFPKFKSRKNDKQSFRLTGSIHVQENRIKLPRIGWIRLKEHGYIPIDYKILSVTVSKRAGRWFCSVLVEEEIKEQQCYGEIIGIDLGIKTLAVCSNGLTFENPKPYRTYQKKLKKVQQEFSRRKKGSKNKDKSRLKLQKIHYKISNLRKDVIHKLTTIVAKTKPFVVVLEDLQIKNLLKNSKLSKSIADASFAEIRRQFEYKSKWYGFGIKIVDKFFPSSKLYSCCGYYNKDLKLSDRTLVCPVCNTTLDRDMNASINLKNTVSSTGINAFGENVRPTQQSSGSLNELGNKQQMFTFV